MGRARGARIGMAVAAGVMAVLVTGCSGGDTAGGAGGLHATSAQADGAARESSGVMDRASGAASDDSPQNLSTTQLTDRKLARSARMSLRTNDVDTAATEARRIVGDAGGYVASERTRREWATLTLTVPSEEMDAVLVKLTDLGERTNRQINVEDLTDQIIDVDSRVASQRESVQRVRELLEQAKSISDLVAIEGELAEREAELESLLARQDALRGQVAMAPITLTLREKPTDNDEDDGGFLGGLATGWGAFTAFLGGTAVVLGASLPFLALVGVLVAIALVVRKWRKHARPAPSPAPASASEA